MDKYERKPTFPMRNCPEGLVPKQVKKKAEVRTEPQLPSVICGVVVYFGVCLPHQLHLLERSESRSVSPSARHKKVYPSVGFPEEVRGWGE